MTDADDIVADYVVVGAGSAGCVLAARLSEEAGVKVVLLEAGGDDRPGREPGQFLSNLMIHVPVGYSRTLTDPKVNWMFKTDPDASSGGRRHAWPRGKVLGGSSSINGLLYIRGQRADYDLWAQLGCRGWSWDDVAPYFRKSQHQERGADEHHGQGGPLNVSDATITHDVSEAVIDACEEAGIPRTADVNGAEQEGASYYQLTVRNGRRCSAAVAYLHPAMKRANLHIETYALATRIVFEGRRAVGVRFTQRGRDRVARATREVILAGGTVNSPQLLHLSGIGPGDLLRSLGIEALVDRPAVGDNLQDHYVMSQTYRLKAGVMSMNELTHGVRFLVEAAKYAARRTGLLTLSAAHVAIFCKSRPEISFPDIQFHVMPGTVDERIYVGSGKMALERRPGLTLAPCQLRPESRGQVRITSPDPTAHPSIRANYLSSEADQRVAVASLELGRRIAAQPALARYIDHELRPGERIDGFDQLLGYARAAGTSIYHPVGTCRMGGDDDAVVDAELRVRGVAGLRVVDASVMPRLVSGNTNAPTIMIAERAAEMILRDGAVSGHA